jgi:diguanylate cyclase (GGDEF)-like protein
MDETLSPPPEHEQTEQELENLLGAFAESGLLPEGETSAEVEASLQPTQPWENPSAVQQSAYRTGYDLAHRGMENIALKAKNDALEAENATLTTSEGLDPKTGLLNAVKFKEMVEAITQHERRPGDPQTSHSLVLADLDNFKRLNELLGYIPNDELSLIPTAQKIKECLRNTDLAARFGGEEFLLFLQGTDVLTAYGVAQRLQNATNEIKLPALVEGRDFLGVSMGIVRYRQGDDYEEVFKRANDLLLQAKDGGRNQIRVEGISD